MCVSNALASRTGSNENQTPGSRRPNSSGKVGLGASGLTSSDKGPNFRGASMLNPGGASTSMLNPSSSVNVSEKRPRPMSGQPMSLKLQADQSSMSAPGQAFMSSDGTPLDIPDDRSLKMPQNSKPRFVHAGETSLHVSQQGLPKAKKPQSFGDVVMSALNDYVRKDVEVVRNEEGEIGFTSTTLEVPGLNLSKTK